MTPIRNRLGFPQHRAPSADAMPTTGRRQETHSSPIRNRLGLPQHRAPSADATPTTGRRQETHSSPIRNRPGFLLHSVPSADAIPTTGSTQFYRMLKASFLAANGANFRRYSEARERMVFEPLDPRFQLPGPGQGSQCGNRLATAWTLFSGVHPRCLLPRPAPGRCRGGGGDRGVYGQRKSRRYLVPTRCRPRDDHNKHTLFLIAVGLIIRCTWPPLSTRCRPQETHSNSKAAGAESFASPVALRW